MILPIGILIAALAALFLSAPAAPILGLSHAGFASAAVGAALIVFIARSGALGRRAANFARAVGALAFWAMLILALTFGWVYRFELGELVGRKAIEGLGGEPIVVRGGEVSVKRSWGGSFVVPAMVDGRPVSLVFDTGASTVVLSAEDAATIGIDMRGLDFIAEVSTANGAATAAPVRLDKISVGPIVIGNVRALVARPGAMSQSLLGMSFLERLESYSVERGKLVMKAR